MKSLLLQDHPFWVGLMLSASLWALMLPLVLYDARRALRENRDSLGWESGLALVLWGAVMLAFALTFKLPEVAFDFYLAGQGVGAVLVLWLASQTNPDLKASKFTQW